MALPRIGRPLSRWSVRAALLPLLAGACVYSHAPSSYTFGDTHCSEIKLGHNYWYPARGGACVVFKVKDGTFAAVMVKNPKSAVSGTVQIWGAAEGGKRALMLKEKSFRVGASSKAQVIASATLSGADKKTYVLYIEVPSGTPQFDYTIGLD